MNRIDGDDGGCRKKHWLEHDAVAGHLVIVAIERTAMIISRTLHICTQT